MLGTIPEYDARRDRHCASYAEKSPQKRSSPTISRPIRSLSVKRIANKHRTSPNVANALRQLRSNLIELWSLERISGEIWRPVVDSIDKLDICSKAEAIKREIEDTQQQKSVLQLLSKAISSREQGIARLRALIRAARTVTRHGKWQKEAKVALGTMRLMTLHVVECAETYRDYILKLNSETQSPVSITYDGQNYLLKLVRDLSFLSQSELANCFDFSTRADPFLLLPAKSQRKDEVPLAAALLGRIRKAERVVIAELEMHREEIREGESEKREICIETSEESDSPSFNFPAIAPQAESPKSRKPLFSGKKQGENETRLPAIENPSGDIPTTPIQPCITCSSSAQSIAPHCNLVPGTPPVASRERQIPQPTVNSPPAFPMNPTSETAVDPSDRLPPPEEAIPQAEISPISPSSRAPSVLPEAKPAKTSPMSAIPDVKISDFHLTDVLLKAEMDAFLSVIPTHIQEVFYRADRFDEILSQSYPSWVQITMAEERIGALSFSIDTQDRSARRVIVHHVSARSMDELKMVMECGIRLIWRETGGLEIGIRLNSREEGDEMVPDQEITAMIASHGFHCESALEPASRAVTWSLSRPSSEPAVQFADFFAENLTIRYAIGVQIGLNSEPREEAGAFAISSVGLAACLAEFPEILTPQNAFQKDFLEFREKLTKDFSFPGFKTAKSEQISDSLALISPQSLSLNGFLDGKSTIISLFSANFSWNNVATAVLPCNSSLIRFIRITNVEINTATVTNYTAFLVPIDKQFSLLLATGGLSGEKCDARREIGTILGKLRSGKEKFERVTQEIWLPGFDTMRPSFIPEEICGLGVDPSHSVAAASEAAHIRLSVPLYSVGNVLLKPSGNAVVISDSFLFCNRHTAIISAELAEFAEVPYLALRVTSEDFSKYAD